MRPQTKAKPSPATPKPRAAARRTQAKTRQRVTKLQQRADKMEQILDAAEYLFRKHGLHGVLLKDVAKRVGAHHTLVNYYFQDKETLFDAVFARRAGTSRALRMAALDRYEAESKGKPTVEGALHAFLDTDLDLYDRDEGWRNYGALAAVASNTPEGAAMLDKHFDPVVLRLIDLLKKAMPNSDEKDIFWCYHFVSGALMLTLARTGRIDTLSGGICDSNDYVSVKARIAAFMAAGFRDICMRRARS